MQLSPSGEPLGAIPDPCIALAAIGDIRGAHGSANTATRPSVYAGVLYTGVATRA